MPILIIWTVLSLILLAFNHGAHKDKKKVV